jgi:hypothetical protein
VRSGWLITGFLPREALKNVGGDALARQIFQKKRSLHLVNEHFFGKFNDARASEVIFQSFPRVLCDLLDVISLPNFQAGASFSL